MNPQKSIRTAVFVIICLNIFSFSRAKESQIISKMHDRLSDMILKWRIDQQRESQNSNFHFTTPVIIAGSLCFAAASLSSAGGVGGGGLFIPILTMVAGLDLKTAASFSALMVTAASIATVFSSMFKKNGDETLIDFDIALLSEPCNLLGVSIGIICNISFPKWLITLMLVVLLSWSTFKTFKSGVRYWKLESEGICSSSSRKATWRELEIPWEKLGLLAVIWFSFCLLHLLRGSRHRPGIIPVESCGGGYWMISALQIPLAIITTSWLLYLREKISNHKVSDVVSMEVGSDTNAQGPDKLIFPVMAFLAGALGGVFGIGGGMLISPLLLQIGIVPEVTAAACSFMVFFSSSMSAFQYILLGMDHIEAAIIFAIACFVGSFIGLAVIQRAIKKHGRPFLIVFAVGLVLALSTVLMTGFGGARLWHDIRSRKHMGFKKPCK